MQNNQKLTTESCSKIIDDIYSATGLDTTGTGAVGRKRRSILDRDKSLSEDGSGPLRSSGHGNPRFSSFLGIDSRRKRTAGETVIDPALLQRQKPLPRIDLFLNPFMENARETYKNESIAKFKNFFEKADMKKIYPNLFRMLWFTLLPCEDILNVTSSYYGENSLLKECILNGEKLDCSSLFKTVPTDSGMCCAFNLRKSLQPSQYSELLQQMQEETHLEDEDWNIIPKVGKKKGLTIILDSHSNQISAGTVADDFKGFQIFVGPKTDFAMMKEGGMLIRPGHENYLEISAQKISADSKVRFLSENKRKCNYEDEKELLLYSKYTLNNYKFECYIRSTEKITKCVPWFLPKTDEMKICSPWETQVFFKEMDREHNCSHCLPDCETTIYSSSVYAAKFRRCDSRNLGLSSLCNLEGQTPPAIWSNDVVEEYRGDLIPGYISHLEERGNRRQFYPTEEKKNNEILKKLIENDNMTTYEAFEEDIAIVHFYFKNPTAFEYRRYTSMTDEGFLSQIGGLFGLCLGFSFLSAVEILYWFVVKLGRNALQRKD